MIIDAVELLIHTLLLELHASIVTAAEETLRHPHDPVRSLNTVMKLKLKKLLHAYELHHCLPHLVFEQQPMSKSRRAETHIMDSLANRVQNEKSISRTTTMIGDYETQLRFGV